MEWEQCKENIKPIRDGRNVSNITTTPKGTALTAKIQDRQAQFENEIKTYEGDDELEVWMRYVQFMEDAYPEGDYQSKVSSIQLRLIHKFDAENYKQDKRLLKVFISLADKCETPTDIYGYCYYHNTCTHFPQFWSNWINCWIYKQRYDKALKICDKAIKVFHKINTFKGMKRHILLGMEATNQNLVAETSQRKVGVALEADDDQNQRDGPKVDSRHKNSSKAFSILKDKNDTETLPLTSTNLLDRSKHGKENAQLKPQRWKNLVMESNPGAVKKSEKFLVFDETPDFNKVFHQYEKDTTALKEKKKLLEKENPVQSVKSLNPTKNLVQTVGYNKSKVYPLTGEEWSFEELEAMKRFKVRDSESRSNSESFDSNASKRSIEEEILPEPKKHCVNEAINVSHKMPRKSCLSASESKFSDPDFNMENPMCSTKKIYLEKNKSVIEDDAVMVPNFSSLSASLNASSCSSKLLSKSQDIGDILPEVSDDGVGNINVNKDALEKSDTSVADILDHDADFTFKGLQENVGVEPEEQLKIHEFLTIQTTTDIPPEVPIKKGIFSKRKLTVLTPIKPCEQADESDKTPTKKFEIFSEFNEDKNISTALDEAPCFSMSSKFSGNVTDFNIEHHDMCSTKKIYAEKDRFSHHDSADSAEYDSFGTDSLEPFQLYEDTVLKENPMKLKEADKVIGAFSTKKNLSLLNPADKSLNIIDEVPIESGQPPAKKFDIFDEFEERKDRMETTSGVNFKVDDFDLNDLNDSGRPSDAFDIFKKSPKPKKLVDASYESSIASFSLKKVTMTPCNNSNNTYVPCTVDKMKTRQNEVCDTQVINKQVLNIFNDCSRISEVDESIQQVQRTDYAKESLFDVTAVDEDSPLKSETYKKPEPCLNIIGDTTKSKQKVKFASFDDSDEISTNETRQSTGSEPTIPTQIGIQKCDFDEQTSVNFDIFTDPFSKDCSQQNVTAEDQISIFGSALLDDKKELTPILEGSREQSVSLSDCSSVDSTKKSSDTEQKDESMNNIQVDNKSKTFDDFRLPEETTITRLSIENTTKAKGTNESKLFDSFKMPGEVTRRSLENTTTFQNQVLSDPMEEVLIPDKTQRDVHVRLSVLTKVPRSSLLPQQPVSDPYDQHLVERLIQSLDPPLFYKRNFNQHDDTEFKKSKQIKLGLAHVNNVVKIGEGAFAEVYGGEWGSKITKSNEVVQRALKIQSPPAPWEFYIINELMERMAQDRIATEVKDMILPVHCIHVFKNSSVLVTNWFNEGSLLDMMNVYRGARTSVPAAVICTYTLDMLRCIEAIHHAQIIHGDIKPDNWLLRDKENTMHSMSMLLTKSVVLIDFGRSIDMKILPEGSQFTQASNTELFECVEMQTNRPWTYQNDYYGILSCIHLMIHNEYMRVEFDKTSNQWKPTKAPHRRLDKDVFNVMFTDLLNIRDCQSIPPLTKYIDEFQSYLKRMDVRIRHDQIKKHYMFMSRR